MKGAEPTFCPGVPSTVPGKQRHPEGTTDSRFLCVIHVADLRQMLAEISFLSVVNLTHDNMPVTQS